MVYGVGYEMRIRLKDRIIFKKMQELRPGIRPGRPGDYAVMRLPV